MCRVGCGMWLKNSRPREGRRGQQFSRCEADAERAYPVTRGVPLYSTPFNLSSAKNSPPSACSAEPSRVSWRFARNTKTRDLGKSPSAIGSAEPSPGSKLRFTRRRLHVPTLRVMPKSRDTKIARSAREAPRTQNIFMRHQKVL